MVFYAGRVHDVPFVDPSPLLHDITYCWLLLASVGLLFRAGSNHLFSGGNLLFSDDRHSKTLLVCVIGRSMPLCSCQEQRLVMLFRGVQGASGRTSANLER